MKVNLDLTDIQLIIIKDALNNHWREAEIKLTEEFETLSFLETEKYEIQKAETYKLLMIFENL